MANLREQDCDRACKQNLHTFLLLNPTVLLSKHSPRTGFHIASWDHPSRKWESPAQKQSPHRTARLPLETAYRWLKQEGGNNKMSFSLYFFHINKDMITHRQAAHQSAEMGHEQAQQEPDSTRCAQTNHRYKPASWNPSLTSVHTRDSSCSPLSLTSMHTGVFSIEEQEQLCKESRELWWVQDSPPGGAEGCARGGEELLHVWSSLVCTGSSTGWESTALHSLTSLPIREAKLQISFYFPALSRTQNSSSSLDSHILFIIIC